jgi:excisionase family DNA binding protein
MQFATLSPCRNDGRPQPRVTNRARSSSQESPIPAQSRLLTVRELADLLQVPSATIYAWRYKRKGPTAIPVGKYLRFRPEDVAAWLEAHAEPPHAEGGPVVAGVGRNLRNARRRRRVPSTPADGPHTHSGDSRGS